MSTRLLMYQVALNTITKLGDSLEAKEENAIVMGHQLDGAASTLNKLKQLVQSLHVSVDRQLDSGVLINPPDSEEDDDVFTARKMKAIITDAVQIVSGMISGTAVQKTIMDGKRAAFKESVDRLLVEANLKKALISKEEQHLEDEKIAEEELDEIEEEEELRKEEEEELIEEQ